MDPFRSHRPRRLISSSSSIRVSSALAVIFLAGAASAQTDAVAENLFRDGKKLLEQKNYAEACPKFAESARIAPSSGVELALGICYEAAGKTASAWGAYSAVIGLARRDARKDREEAATSHLASLETKLARVTFVVAKESAALTGFELRQDGVLLGSAAWSGTPIDPGDHTLEARAPGYVPYSTTFTVAPQAGARSVPVPPLAPVPVVVAPPPVVAPVVVQSASPPPVESHPSLLRPAGYVIGGVGVASLIAGAVLGGVAIGKVSAVHSACPGGKCTSASGVSDDSTAGSLADASTGTFIAGGVLVAAGVVMVLLSPARPGPLPSTSGFTVKPLLGPGVVGLTGAF